MNQRVCFSALFSIVSLSFAAVACGDSEPSDGETKAESPIVLEEIQFDLAGDRLLSSLSDEEIVAACGKLAAGIESADEAIACRVVAVGEADDVDACVEAREDCLSAPGDAGSEVTISSSPAPISCSAFNAALTEGCDYPVSLLLDCANALADSVVPSGDAVSCENAGDFSSVTEANKAALDSQGIGFVEVCLDLVACEALVQALFEGSETGAGGANN